MANKHGDFIWYELMTADPATSRDFFGAVCGWQIDAEGQQMPNGAEYRMIRSAAGGDVGGVLTLTKEMQAGGAVPAILGYVLVEDVDAAVERATALGGSSIMPAFDVEGVGRMALIADPHGAPIYIMRSTEEGESRVFQPSEPGHVAWNELSTTDPEAAMGFYSALFGWTAGEVMDMGEQGKYRMFEQGGRAVGAIQPAPEGTPPSWLFYVAVPDIVAAHDAISSHRGKIMHGPSPVPGDVHIVIAHSPEGVVFGTVGPQHS